MCSHGVGGGAAIVTLQLQVSDDSALRAWLCEDLFPRIVTQRGIVGAHLLRGDEAASRTPTEEKAMRDRPDDISAWVVFVEGLEAADLQALRADALGDAALRAHGVTGIAAGLYRLHYTLTEVDLASAGV